MSNVRLRLPNIPSWPYAALREVCSVISRGKAPSYVEQSDVHAIGQRCVTSAGFDASFARPHDERVVSGHLRPESGDVLLNSTGTGTIGRTAVFSGANQFIVDGHVTVLRAAPPQCNGQWLANLLACSWGQQHLERFCYTGSTNQVELNRSALAATEIPLPPAPEQSAIARILDTLDTQIEKTQALIAKLEQVKEGLLHDLLTRGVNENGELRPSAEEAPELYKASPLGLIPMEWDVVALESVSSLVTSGSRDWARFYAESGALFVRIGNLTREHINFRYDSAIYVRPPHDADGQRTRLEAGDILISITADLGIVGVVPSGIGEAYINQHIALVRPLPEMINSRFVGHYLACGAVQTHISKLNDAGAKSGLNLPTIRGLLTALPIRREQDAIASRLDEIDDRISNLKAESGKLRELKAGLMDDLLTGRVRVTPLLDPQETPVTV